MATLSSFIDLLEQETAWREPASFHWRADAADRIELLLLGERDEPTRQRAAALIDDMARIDAAVFAGMRDAIRRGEGRAVFAPWLDVGIPTGQHYDVLDHVVAGVLAIEEPHVDAAPMPRDMVFYQPSPARHIVDGIARAGIGRDDIVLDLGAGLGHVPILVNVLTGARALGVEREPRYVRGAMKAAASLDLGGVHVVEGDARDADLSPATVLYLFTPFVGTVLRDVVARIEREARERHVRIVALGPCTRTFARMAWLRSDDADPSADDRIVVFHTRLGGR